MPSSTKDKIADAIDALAQQKDAERITVKAVIEKSGVSRQTFYYYFQDLMDAVEYALRRKTQAMVAQNTAHGDLKGALHQMVAAVARDRTMFRRMVHSPRRDRVEQLLVQGVREYLQALMCAAQSDPDLKYSEAETALSFYTYGVVGILLDCCRKPDPDVQRLTERLYALLKGQSLLF